MYKYIFSLICLLGVALGASAQGYRYQNTISGPRGPLANVPVAVCSQPATISSAPCSPLATLYTDSTLTTACNGTNGCSNPLTSDGYGNVLFYAAPGKYTIQYYGPQFSAPVAYQDIVLPCDPSNCTITGGNLTVSSLNKIVYADQQAGATADVKIAAAITALGAPGGTIDARGFGATSQSWAATVTVPTGVTILFDPKTYFGPSSAALNLFKLEPSAAVDGFTMSCASQPTYSGNVFENDTASAYTDGNNTRADNITILCSAVGTGTGLSLSSTGPSTPIVWLRTSHWRQYGLLNQILATASGDGFVNDNHFIDMYMGGAGTGITSVQLHLTPNNGQIDGNQCVECSFQSHSTTDLGFLVDGTSGANDDASNNLYVGDCWDSTVDCVNFSGNSKATNNQVVGFSNHGISDTNGSNGNYSYNQLTALGGIFIGGFPTETGPTQITHNSSSTISGITGTNYCIGESKVAFLQCLDNSGNMGIAGVLNSTGLASRGTAATLTGTGACATNSTQKGGAWAGQATCTGTTGASTFIITPGTTAPNGWSCTASDLTTAANILRQSVSSTTACTIAGTVNANDVLTFTAVAY